MHGFHLFITVKNIKEKENGNYIWTFITYDDNKSKFDLKFISFTQITKSKDLYLGGTGVYFQNISTADEGPEEMTHL